MREALNHGMRQARNALRSELLARHGKPKRGSPDLSSRRLTGFEGAVETRHWLLQSVLGTVRALRARVSIHGYVAA